MTHSLHRQGSEDSLKNDYVLLCTPAKGMNNKDSREKLLKILDIIMEVGPSNIGFYGHGCILCGISIDEVKKTFHDNSRIRCNFDDITKLKKALYRIKAENLGLSITVSGLIRVIEKLSLELELTPHTINIACGFYGKTDRLPSDEILELSTMCGHGMISHSLVESIVDDYTSNKIDKIAAIRKMGEPCLCGIFNPTRAQNILQMLYEKRNNIAFPAVVHGRI